MNNSIAFAKDIRKKTLEMVYKAKASHIGGAFSMADLLAVLYSDVLKINPADPDNEMRDRFLLSKGHACASLYATLGLKGFFPLSDLDTYTADGSHFLSHTSHYVPGVEVSAGSLGHALPVTCGLAIAAKRKQKNQMNYCLISDGELNEGSNWETILLAPQLQLDNLVLIVDYNKIQSFGFVKDIIDIDPLNAKFSAFRWEVIEIDGHDHEQIRSAFKACENKNGVPKVIIANTIKGKGVSFMENKLLWHYKSPSEEEYTTALKELA